MTSPEYEEIVLSEYAISVTTDGRLVHRGVKNVQSSESGLVTNLTGARDNLTEFYEEEYALYEESAGSETAVYTEESQTTKSKAVASFILQHWEPGRNPRILDFGCGKGLLLEQLALAIPEAEFTGIEPNQRAKKQIKANSNLDRVRLTELDDLLESGEQFDLVATNNVLEHVADPAVVLAHLRKLVVAGGYFFTGVPNFKANPLDLFQYDHLSRFTPSTLTHLLQQSGFAPFANTASTTQVPMWWMSKLDTPRMEAPDSDTVASQLQLVGRLQYWLDSSLSSISAAVADARAAKQSIIIYGTGNLWTAMIGMGLVEESDAHYIVDDNASLWGSNRVGGRVESPEEAFSPEIERPLVIISTNPCYFERITERIHSLIGTNVVILPRGLGP